ncbi:MAG: TetR/AcrR family transcriptional regulator [Gammaproteobacteria bacterium]
MRSNRRDELISTAVKLFARQGYHATGIDQIIAESGVAKMTLYNHFKSKNELILAALRRYDEDARHRIMRSIERRARNPRERLLALFDVLDEWFTSDKFFGCMFINATAEFAQHDDPIHAVAEQHKRLLRNYLREQALAAGAQDPDNLVEQICLLMDGAIVTAQINGQSTAAQARSAAEVLLAQALD